MHQHSVKWSTTVALAVLISLAGCGKKPDEGFHTYNDSESSAPPEGGSGVLISAPESPPVPSPDSATGPVAETAKSVTPPEATPAALPPMTKEMPEKAGSTTAAPVNAAPTEAAAAPSEPAASAVHELALGLPPAPPVAAPLAASIDGGSPPMAALEIKLLVPEKEFQVEGPEGAIRVSFDDVDLLKVLNAEPVPNDIEKHLPAWLSGLNGKTVRIRGWMYPPPQETDIPAFLFVRDNQICCFGRMAKIYDKFGVKLREGVTTNYIQGRPFDVVGQMVVKSVLLDGELFFLYKINDAIIIDK